MLCDWLATGAMVPHTNDLVAQLPTVIGLEAGFYKWN